jgi:hypothetical protein
MLKNEITVLVSFASKIANAQKFAYDESYNMGI